LPKTALILLSFLSLDQDLKDLGVVLGDRRKNLRAIAGLKSTEAVAPNPAIDAVIAPPQDTAERRQVTVMFSDLVGSTALSARMDPEDLREVISAYQKCVTETVKRFGGFVAKYMGDGVLVYFGYPQAHEDDAERAVRAGLGVFCMGRERLTRRMGSSVRLAFVTPRPYLFPAMSVASELRRRVRADYVPPKQRAPLSPLSERNGHEAAGRAGVIGRE
jgi:hypothetical protein